MIVKKYVDLRDRRGSPKGGLLLCVEARRGRGHYIAVAVIRRARDKLLFKGLPLDLVFVAVAVTDNLY